MIPTDTYEYCLGVETSPAVIHYIHEAVLDVGQQFDRARFRLIQIYRILYELIVNEIAIHKKLKLFS